jgi:hypothetical protein
MVLFFSQQLWFCVLWLLRGSISGKFRIPERWGFPSVPTPHCLLNQHTSILMQETVGNPLDLPLSTTQALPKHSCISCRILDRDGVWRTLSYVSVCKELYYLQNYETDSCVHNHFWQVYPQHTVLKFVVIGNSYWEPPPKLYTVSSNEPFYLPSCKYGWSLTLVGARISSCWNMLRSNHGRSKSSTSRGSFYLMLYLQHMHTIVPPSM